MPGRGHLWPLVFVLAGCASFFPGRSDLKKGIALYNKNEVLRALPYFERYYQKNDRSDTVLYFLYNCYRHLNDPDRSVQSLERLIALDVNDPNVYLNVYYYYRAGKRYPDMLRLLAGLQPSISRIFDQRFPLTRQELAALLYGAAGRKSHSDPMIFALSENLLPVFPDRNLYPDDTISMAQLIIILDRRIDPDPPADLSTAVRIAPESFLYLPYMRLVGKGILALDPNMLPTDRVPLTTAARAIVNMKNRGFLE